METKVPVLTKRSALDSLPIDQLLGIATRQVLQPKVVPNFEGEVILKGSVTARTQLLFELIKKTIDVPRKRALQNLLRKLTSRNVDFGYGHRQGTPMKGKTRTRLALQDHFGMTRMAKRIRTMVPDHTTGALKPGVTHPTKAKTWGRMEMFA